MLIALVVLLAGLLSGARVPGFERVLVLDAAREPAANVSIGDLDGDGSLDLVLVKGRHWPAKSRVFLGDGRGHFRAASDLAETAYRSYSGRLADLDGDGDLADLDGDGRPDIVVANRTDKAPVDYVCLNQGKGRFDAACSAFAKGSATSITAADFNRDGLPDLAVPARDGGQRYVYLNGGNNDGSGRNYTSPHFGDAKGTVYGFAIADLDGDGQVDVAVARSDAPSVVFFGRLR